jgi:aldehyde dehydrogenase (NAD+)
MATAATTVRGNFIAGRWAEADAAARDENPSDLDDVVGEYALGSVAQVQEALEAARAAAPAWGRSGIETRAGILDRIGAELIARCEELGRVLAREEGKTLAEGIGEAAGAGATFRWYAGEVLRPQGDLIGVSRADAQVEVSREPLGVVALITPWNYPLGAPASKIAAALAYGNCVVFKPAGLVPASAWELAEIVSRSGVPAGAFNLVMGSGSVAGDALARSPLVDGISFTGSVSTGRSIARHAIESMARVQLEMGGKNPLVVLDDADLDTAVDAAVRGGFYATGQRCTASSRVIATAGIHDRLVAGMVERLRSVRVDHALKAGTDIGPVVDAAQLETDLGYIAAAEAEGATLATGGELLQRETRGHYLAPALFTDTTNEMRINREEVFGPVASVIRVADYDEALAVANDTEFGLCAGIVTDSLKHAMHFKRNAEVGVVTVNMPTAGLDGHVPFGGRKASSYGPREQSSYAREFYTIVKTAFVAP